MRREANVSMMSMIFTLGGQEGLSMNFDPIVPSRVISLTLLTQVIENHGGDTYHSWH